MAVLLLHLHHTHPYSSSRRISGQIPLSLPKFKIAFLLSGKVIFLQFRKKKLSFPYGICSGKSWKPSETDNKYVSSEPNETDVIKWEKDGEINECYHFKENYFVHQRMTPFLFGSAVLVMANALILTLPFEALAETCEADNSLFNMPLLLIVALIGATVGGLLARERKAELRRLNDQLCQINAAFRRQAKVESYAPTLSYAPAVGRIPENEVIVDSRKHELISHLKSGKNCLRNQDPEKAYQEFKVALELAQSLKDPIEEKKAARGLGASLQRQRKYREAIKYHSMVLSISDREGEDSGNTEAYGAIADCYTELGDLERAGKFYDEYIARLEKD